MVASLSTDDAPKALQESVSGPIDADFVVGRRGEARRQMATMEVLYSEPDELIAERAKTDVDAFGILYERHLKRIYSYIYYRTGNTHDAEDLTEKTFFQALANLQRYQIQGAPFAAWLYRIAHNIVANWHRDTGRRQSVQLDAIVELRDPMGDPVAAAESEEEKVELRGVIAKLPADRQQLLILKFVEQMANAEIAQVMGRTEGAVKALLHRTIESLKTEFARSREEMQGHVAKTRQQLEAALQQRWQDEPKSAS